MNKTGFVLMLFGAAIIAGFLMRNQEGFIQQEVGMPLSGPPMGLMILLQVVGCLLNTCPSEVSPKTAFKRAII